MVLIHGGVLSSAEWDEQFTPLAEHYRVIRYDVRGCGKSETRKLPYSNSEDLYQLLRFLKVEKTVVIGGSMGGSVGRGIGVLVGFPSSTARLAHSLLRGHS